jgi:hypothetical protein
MTTTLVKPGRPCSVCSSPHRQQIDLEIVKGTPIARISRRYADLTDDAISRHAKRHIPSETLLEALERRSDDEKAHGTGLALEARKMRAKAIQLLLAAEQAGDLQGALRGVREANACLVTEAKLRGEWDSGPGVNVGVKVETEPRYVVILPANGRESPDTVIEGEAKPF